jgi:D-inositol-3-phosphate glycosyltransferase
MGKIKRLAMLCVHTSPLAALGGSKTGGMNVYVRELARELGARGVIVDIYTRRAAPDTPEVDHSLGDNVRVISVPCGPAAPLEPNAVYPHVQQFTAGVLAFTMLNPVTYDFIYSHYWLSGWAANKLREVWGTPFAQMFHTLGQMKNRISGEPITLPDTRILGETKLVEQADLLIAATPAEHSQLLWLYRADRRKIAIVPPGVDIAQFRPTGHYRARAALGLGDDERLLLFVGRLEPLKAVDTILLALERLRLSDPHTLAKVRFAIIGGAGGPEGARLQALTRELDLGDRVSFLGAKDHAALTGYYAAATAVIMPSDYESFGMVALEAMASGTPVIATKVGGLAYLVRDAETGYLVPARDPGALAGRIATLVNDDLLRAELGERAAQAARNYAWPLIADRVLAAFEQAMTRPRRPARV